MSANDRGLCSPPLPVKAAEKGNMSPTPKNGIDTLIYDNGDSLLFVGSLGEALKNNIYPATNETDNFARSSPRECEGAKIFVEAN
jgi:hypothetical protein